MDCVALDAYELTFVSGQSVNGTQCAELVVLDDDILEMNEIVNLQLSNSSDLVVITVGMEIA